MPTAWLLGCASGADPFIEKYFSDCVYSLRDYIGFCLGLAAILFWIVAQVPQWVRNYRTKSAEALSPWFLAQWLLGDTFNLLGCLLQGQQLPTTTYTAMYFVVADVFMMIQYIYYGALQRRKEQILQLQVHRRHHHRRHQGQHGRGRAQQHSPGTYGQIAGYDSSTKEHGVYQRQQAQQQRSRKQWQQHSAGQQHDLASSSHDEHSKQHQYNFEEQEQQLPQLEVNQQQQQQPSSLWQGSLEAAAGEALLPQSCTTAARLHSLPQPGLMLGSMPLGSYKSAVAVGVLVAMGVVSLAVPANTTWGVMPAEGAAAKVTAPQRAMQVGKGSGAEALHSISLLNSSADSSLAAAGVGLFSSQTSAQHSSSGDNIQPLTGPERDIMFVVGTVLGYCSSVLYLCSRLSQIHKNHTRKSSEGLALAMFMMAVCANLCTGTGIVMRTFTLQELKEQLPWIIGSLGTISLDMVILWQSIRYGDKEVAGAGGDASAAATAANHHHHQQQQVTIHLNQQRHPHHHEQQRQLQQRNWPGRTALTSDGYSSAAAYNSSAVALPASAAIHIPNGQRTSSSDAGMGFWSSSAPVTAVWGSLSDRQAQNSTGAAGGLDETQEAGYSDAAAPLLPALN